MFDSTLATLPIDIVMKNWSNILQPHSSVEGNELEASLAFCCLSCFIAFRERPKVEASHI